MKLARIAKSAFAATGVAAWMAAATPDLPQLSATRLCVFTTGSLNELFKAQGHAYKWDYSSPPFIDRSADHSRIVAQYSIDSSVFTIRGDAPLSVFDKGKWSAAWIGPDAKPIALFSGGIRTIRLVGPPTIDLPLQSNESRPRFDTSGLFFVRRYFESLQNSRKESYELFEVHNPRVRLLSRQGRLVHLESRKEDLYLVEYHMERRIFIVGQYRVEAGQATIISETEVKEPEPNRTGRGFGFGDYDVGRQVIAFVDFAFPAGPFSRDFVWLFDVNQKSFTWKRPIARSRGNRYALFVTPELYSRFRSLGNFE